MYNSILIPLDGSELAEVTLYYAQGLAGSLQSKVTLVYVTDPGDLTSRHMYECYLKDMVTRVKDAADKRASERGNGDITVDYKILEGNPAEEIVDYANKAKIDLIVMSTQGRSGIKRWELGNVANKVVTATRRQVFLVRAKGAESDVHKERLRKVLVPVDGSKESESIIKYITYLATKLDLEVTLLHMWALDYQTFPRRDLLSEVEKTRKTKKNYIERLASKLEKDGVKAKPVFTEIMFGDEAEEIIRQADEGDYSLVAMATHGRSGLGRWVFGSNANKVLYEGSSPLLLIRPIKRSK